MSKSAKRKAHDAKRDRRFESDAMEYQTFQKPRPADKSANVREAYFIPPRDSIPMQFFSDHDPVAAKWRAFAREWFYEGLKRGRIIVNPEFNFADALFHLGVIQQSFLPSHEHKQAAVAWLASKWFCDFTPSSENK